VNLGDFRLLPDLAIPEDNGHVQLFQTLPLSMPQD
jgi:hypothetical protein